MKRLGETTDKIVGDLIPNETVFHLNLLLEHWLEEYSYYVENPELDDDNSTKIYVLKRIRKLKSLIRGIEK